MPRVVLSASRRTDIPAFYMPWFMACIEQGYFNVVNPYNRRTTKIPVTTASVHSIVFWSKNFGPFLSCGDGKDLTRSGHRLFFNFTINSPHNLLEPNIPPLEERLEQLSSLASTFGPQSIQWRFDPICFFEDATGRESNNLACFDTIARRVAEAGVRYCITSFADPYRKVEVRMKRTGALTLIDLPMERKVEIIAELAHRLSAVGVRLQLCCEKSVMEALPADVPVTASACIPADRLIRLYGSGISTAKDRGQRTRAGCNCGISKDIGSYALHPCGHNCLYCYANPKIDRKSRSVSQV